MARIDDARAVVESGETYDGRIVPTARAELDRQVRIRDEATVLGSVYGDTVETSPRSEIEGSVMASEAVELDRSRIHGEVGTPGKVVGAGSRVDGTVTGQRIRLTDSVVRGNVVGDNVILENCVVLGLVTAEENLLIENSLCYTLRGLGETYLEDTTTVLPQAIVDGQVELETPVTVAGLGTTDVAVDSGTDGEALPTMDESDLYESGKTGYLTLAPRILNPGTIDARLAELERGIMGAVGDLGDAGAVDLTIAELLDRLGVDDTIPDHLRQGFA
jgi:cytoskeletal protein CcmA (bactofilin family)